MKLKLPKWFWGAFAVVVLAAVVMGMKASAPGGVCPGSQTYCPGVGCLSGPDKCIPGSTGGPSAVFSKEGFEIGSFPSWNITKPAPIEMKTCPGKLRSDGPCLMQFPA
jgi:hypothetical protein